MDSKIVFIKDYLVSKSRNITNSEIAEQLGISLAMISSYKNQGYKASIKVALRAYQLDGIILHPFSEESLKYELNKDKK